MWLKREIKPDQNDGDLQWLYRNGSITKKASEKSHLRALSIPVCMYRLASSYPIAHRTVDRLGSTSPQLQGVRWIHGISTERFKAFCANMDWSTKAVNEAWNISGISAASGLQRTRTVITLSPLGKLFSWFLFVKHYLRSHSEALYAAQNCWWRAIA